MQRRVEVNPQGSPSQGLKHYDFEGSCTLFRRKDPTGFARSPSDLEIGLEHCPDADSAIQRLTRQRFEALIVDCNDPLHCRSGSEERADGAL